MLLNCLAVGCGGFVGSVLRYLAGSVVPHDAFPWHTLAVNVVGSFVLALVSGLVLRGAPLDERLSLLLRVGLCGGFTTMSTFSLEVVQLASTTSALAAVGYAALTGALCIGASALGYAL